MAWQWGQGPSGVGWQPCSSALRALSVGVGPELRVLLSPVSVGFFPPELHSRTPLSLGSSGGPVPSVGLHSVGQTSHVPQGRTPMEGEWDQSTVPTWPQTPA